MQLLESIFAYEFGTESLLSLRDIQCSLPCREHVWDRPTFDSIMREKSYSGKTTQCSILRLRFSNRRGAVPFLDALEMLYIEKKLAPKLSEFSRIIMIYSIIQRTKAAVSQCQNGLVSWMPSASRQPRSASRRVEESWPPSLPILSRWRNSACDGLDVLHWNATSLSAGAGGPESPIHFHLHLSRLILLTPTDALQTLASTVSVPRVNWTESHKRSANMARDQVLRWAIDDQFKARLAVIHAGAVFWHVRRYSIDSFLEPFGVYMATLVLWAYSTSVQFAPDAHRAAVEREPVPIQNVANGPSADTSPHSASSPMSDLDEDDEPLQFHLDRPCDDEIVQTYVKHGQRMSPHLSHVGNLCEKDAPKKILLQGQNILQKRKKVYAQSPEEADDVSPLGRKGDYVWGATEGLSEMLRGLSEWSGT